MSTMSSSSSSKKTNILLLKSFDDKIFEIEKTAALALSHTLKIMIDNLDFTVDKPILIPLVNGKTLVKVIEYCNMHAEDKEKKDVEVFDKEFVDTDLSELFEVVLAASYLNIQKLLDLTSEAVRNMIKTKSKEEINEFFGIVDYTPEEEEAIRADNPWALS